MITISCVNDEHFYHFHISDNGSGTEKRHLRQIFKERQTLDKADRFGNKGTGVGLAEVKNIVDAIGGEITVTSERHIGSDFKISIPACLAYAAN